MEARSRARHPAFRSVYWTFHSDRAGFHVVQTHLGDICTVDFHQNIVDGNLSALECSKGKNSSLI